MLRPRTRLETHTRAGHIGYHGWETLLQSITPGRTHYIEVYRGEFVVCPCLPVIDQEGNRVGCHVVGPGIRANAHMYIQQDGHWAEIVYVSSSE